MDLLQVIKNHEKDFMKWFYDGEDFSDKLEEALVEAFKDQIPYTVLTGETSNTSEWLNDNLCTLDSYYIEDLIVRQT